MEKSDFRVLIVDDEEDILETLKLSLELEGYQISTARSGNEGLGKVLSEDYNFILSDVRMSDGDGLFFLEKVREMNSRVPPFLLFSGFSEIDKETAIEKGAINLLDKPLDFDLIQHYIEETYLKLK